MKSVVLATFESECDENDYKVRATILFSGYGFGGGFKKLGGTLDKVGATGSKITVEDDSDIALTQNLEGSAILTSATIAAGKGGSFTDFNFGNVRTTGFSSSGGFGFGGSVTFGTAKHINTASYPYSRVKCTCEDY